MGDGVDVGHALAHIRFSTTVALHAAAVVVSRKHWAPATSTVACVAHGTSLVVLVGQVASATFLMEQSYWMTQGVGVGLAVATGLAVADALAFGATVGLTTTSVRAEGRATTDAAAAAAATTSRPAAAVPHRRALTMTGWNEEPESKGGAAGGRGGERR